MLKYGERDLKGNRFRDVEDVAWRRPWELSDRWIRRSGDQKNIVDGPRLTDLKGLMATGAANARGVASLMRLRRLIRGALLLEELRDAAEAAQKDHNEEELRRPHRAFIARIWLPM